MEAENYHNSTPVLGIDIGGTKIASALSIEGVLHHKKVLKTPSNSSQEEILKTIVSHIRKYEDYNFKKIGIGIPGLINTEKGIVYNLANIPSFQEVGLKSYLEDIFEVPVFINNDANCFALGEHQQSSFQHMVGITLGTGIGTGVIANSNLYSGYQCGAGEWGAVPYLDKTYEDYCSSKFFLAKSGENSKTIYKRALNSDPYALALLQEFGMHLGKLIKQILFIYAPEAIVLGGSLSKAFPFYKETLKEMINTFPYKSISKNLTLYVSSLDDSAIHGAVALTHDSTITVPFHEK